MNIWPLAEIFFFEPGSERPDKACIDPPGIGAAETGFLRRFCHVFEGEAVGFEIDAQWLATDNLLISGGFAYNDTEINDSTLSTAPCGSGLCTVLDPVNPSNSAQVLVNGNPFPRAPETTYNFEVRYSASIGGDLFPD